jgi:YHS domain-containing protein
MFKRNLVITVLVVVGLSIAAVVSAGMHSQRKGMSCMGGMMAMGETDGAKGMHGMGAMADMDKDEMAQQPAAAEKKKGGEEFTCPVDGMHMQVTEQTPTAEHQGKIYHFCNEADKQTFLKDPERYVKGKSAQ